MPITLPVEGIADRRSFDRVADDAQKRFAKAGKDSGAAFAKGLDDAASKADPKSAERWTKAYDKVADAAGKVRVEEAKLSDLRDRGASNTKLIQQSEALERARRAETRATREAANAYQDLRTRASGIGSTLVDLTSGTRFGGLIADTQRLSQSFGGIGLAAGAAITGVAGLAVGIGVAATKLYELGSRWDDVADSITARTGLMGDQLSGVMDQVSRVALDSSVSISQLGDIAGQVTALMGTSGDGLGDLTAYIGDLNRMTGQQTNIRQLAMLYRMFGIEARDQVGTLNDLYGAFTKTQTPVNDLMGALLDAGPAAKQLGLDIGQTSGLLAQFAEAGIEPTKAVAGLNRLLTNTAKDGKDASTGLIEVIGKMQALIAANRETEAQQLAIANFGKTWQPFLDAVKQGKLSVDQLSKGMQENDKDIRQVAASTDDLAEQWDRFKNVLEVGFMPAATGVFNVLNNQLEGLIKTFQFFNDLISAPQGPYSGGSATYPGQTVSPAIPGAGGGIAPPSTGSITGNGTMLENMLDGVPGAVAPPGLTGPQPSGIGGDGTGGGIGGSGGGSGSITLPYPAEYGGPMLAGESDPQYQARMANIAAEHNLAEARAKLNQLEASGIAEASELVAANNAVIDAQIRADQAARRQRESLTQSVPGIGVPFAPGYAEGPRPGQTASQFSAESSLYQAQQKSAQAAAEYEQLMASGTATTTELTLAHNELVQATRNENEAALRLSESYARTSDQMGNTSKQLGEIGAQLDSDLGISNGLAGVADNITRFVASLAMAPVIGALKGVQASTGVDASKSGSGLAGIVGSMMGLGVQPGQNQTPSGSGPIASPPRTYGPAAAAPRMSTDGYMGDAALLSMVPKGGRYDAAGDLTQGLADCTSGIEDLVNLMDGRPTAGRNMHTNANVGGAAAEWLTANGFLPTDVPVPGAFQVGYNAGHMEGTLPGGTPVNFGSDAAVASGGTAGAGGAWSPGLTSQYYRPVSGMPAGGVGMPVRQPGSASLGGQSIPVPLPVTIVGGMPGGGGISVPGITGSPGAASSGSTTTSSGGGPTSIPGAAPATIGGGGGSTGGGFAPITPGQLTSPGLLTPTPLTGGGAGTGGLLPGMAGPPQSLGGGNGIAAGGNLFGGALGAPPGPAAPSTVGGITPAGGRGEGGLGVAGGLAGMAMSALSSAAGAGGMAANAMAPGAGAAVSAAADIGIKLANRAAQFAGQAAGIGVGGLMETFLPVDSALADPMNSWFGRIVGGMMGAAPNLPNMAGQAANAPQGQGQGAAPTADGRPPITVNYTNQQATEDRAGADLTNHLMAMNTGPGQ